MKPLLLILLLLLQGVPRADQGMEVGFSMPYVGTAVPGRPIVSMSGFLGTVRPFPGFSEYGFLAMVPIGEPELDPAGRSRITELVGMYAGQLFLPFHGLVRPGFNLGWLWERQSGFTREGAVHSDRVFSLYYAFKLQFSCLTFQVSNIGVGGGINFSL
jgi:hypothetical protein